MKRDRQVWCVKDRPMPGEGIINAGRQPGPNTLFFTACAYFGGLGVTKRDTNQDRLIAFPLNLLDPRWVSFRKMQAGVNKYVDLHPCGLEQRKPQRVRDGASFCIYGDNLT